MRAEAVVQEWKRHGEVGAQEHVQPHGRTTQPRRLSEPPVVETVQISSTTGAGSSRFSTGASSEMTLKVVKCFNCKKKGHLARSYPEPTEERHDKAN